MDLLMPLLLLLVLAGVLVLVLVLPKPLDPVRLPKRPADVKVEGLVMLAVTAVTMN